MSTSLQATLLVGAAVTLIVFGAALMNGAGFPISESRIDMLISFLLGAVGGVAGGEVYRQRRTTQSEETGG